MRWKVLARIKSTKLQERREEIVKALFKNRDLKTKKQQKEFLNPKDPCQLTLQDVGISLVQLNKALKRIRQAIKKKEKVIVYGDYDTDGVCATAIMWETLNKLGLDVLPFIPRREEGYGLKASIINQMAKEGVKLIITVDQGIVAYRQVTRAKKTGIDVIITDHHQPGKKKPKAKAIIHTTQLAGCGVAWFLAKWLVEKIKSKAKPLGLDLVTIGTITDMVPLIGPNRSIVKFGLSQVNKTKRAGLLALYQFAGLDKKKIDTYEVGFIIGPRINASGRMDDPMEALRLICTNDENRAISLAQKIDQKNRERQELMKQTTLHARELWLKEDGESSLIFIYHQSYEHGVVGLVASKLKDEFYRPAIILAPRKDRWVGSGRSIEEFNIIEAIRELKDIIGDHGGHRLAAGFDVSQEKLEEAKQRLIKKAEKDLGKKKLGPRIEIEIEVELIDLNLALYQEVNKFAPFGMNNPQPVFSSRQVRIANLKKVGADNQHLKFRVNGFEVIAFGQGELLPQLSTKQPVDLAYNLFLNQWNGLQRLELKIKDIKIPE
ncbi:single-stranded-DNA-specific exonuclease RecJ [Microgenomates group bacterium RBG_19FT_COMBO_39_10]|nr:MAG: single-stranded-DNA-specific exonuclease RecJ [Microgenomates group bacterium RBG_19FT_COMBO_39_10]